MDNLIARSIDQPTVSSKISLTRRHFPAERNLLLAACRITCEATNALVALFREARNGPRGFRAGNNGRRVALTSRWLSVAVCWWQYCFVPSPAGGHEPPRFHHPDIYRSHSVFLCAVLFQRLYIVAESFTTAGHINRLIVHRGMFNSLS